MSVTYRLLCYSLLLIAITAAFTRYYFPSVQVKTVETVKEVVKTDVKTVIKTVKLPNGAEETTTTIVDHTMRAVDDTKSSLQIKPKDWVVSGYVASDFRPFTPEYGVQVQRRILGPVLVGALLSNRGNIGLSVGLEF